MRRLSKELELTDANMRAALERGDYEQALMYAEQCEAMAEHLMHHSAEPPFQDVFTFSEMNHLMWYYRDQIRLIERMIRRKERRWRVRI